MKIQHLAKNQVVFSRDARDVFVSYSTVVAAREGRKVILDINALDYSTTTSKYLAIYLGIPMKEVRRRAKAGEYEFADLNDRKDKKSEEDMVETWLGGHERLKGKNIKSIT